MKKKKETKTPQEIWKGLEFEYNKIFDNFKYLNEPDRIMLLNIIIGESIKFSRLPPLTCEGLLNQINSDISSFVRTNLSIPMGNEKMPTYLG